MGTRSKGKGGARKVGGRTRPDMGVVRDLDVPDADAEPLHCRPALEVVGFQLGMGGTPVGIGVVVCASPRGRGCASPCALGELGSACVRALRGLREAGGTLPGLARPKGIVVPSLRDQ